MSGNLNAPKNLDSEAILNAIEVQQGILVERAEDTYSFSHLTLQEYLAAQYLVDNQVPEEILQRYITNSRWREVLSLMPGLMPGKSKTDNFLLSIEKEAQTCLELKGLSWLITWVTTHTEGATKKLNIIEKKAIAVLFISEITITFYFQFSTAQSIDNVVKLENDDDIEFAFN